MASDKITKKINFTLLEYEKIDLELKKNNISFENYAKDIILNHIDQYMLLHLDFSECTDFQMIKIPPSILCENVKTNIINKPIMEDCSQALITQTGQYNFYYSSKRVSQELLNNSYKVAMNNIESIDTQALVSKLPIGNIQIDKANIIKNIQNEYHKFEDLFSEPSRYKYIKNNNHYFSCLYKGQNFSFDQNKQPYFIELSDALVAGYLAQEILANVDSNLIKTLNTLISDLAYVNANYNKKQIELYQKSLKFFKNKKYLRYYASLLISKKLNMTTNQSIQYRKNVLDRESVNKSAHEQAYESFQIFDFLDILKA